MPAVAKIINVLGALAKIETTYGTSIALTTTSDGFLLTYPDRNVGAPIDLSYSFDGFVGVNPGNLSSQPLVPPGGKSFSGGLPVRFKGSGAAYTASVKPALADIVLRCCGLVGALTTTTGAEAWTYTPAVPTTAYESASMNLYARGELWPLKGVIGTFGFTFNDPAPPIVTWDINGIANGNVVDTTLPSITYPHLTIDPPNANGITLVIGSFTTNAVCYSGSFKWGRTVEPRVALTSGVGHEGFIPGGYQPELTLVVEDTAFVGSPFHTSAGLDPILLNEAATKITVSVQFGSTQYNKWKVTLSNAQIWTVKPTSVNRAACWEITFRPSASTPIALDDLSFLFN